MNRRLRLVLRRRAYPHLGAKTVPAAKRVGKVTNKYRKIFVLFPQGVRTGGPEALVQLVHCLRSLGQDAYLVPLPGTEKAEHVQQFAIYNAPVSAETDDSHDCAIVVPEMALSQIRKYRRAARYVWWLSIDFSNLFFALKRLESLQGRGPGVLAKRMVLHLMRVRDVVRLRALSRDKHVKHLAQSHYARSFLYAQSGLLASIVSDFTPVDDFKKRADITSNRGRRVAFNPAKGAESIAEIRDRIRPDWELVPIQGMTRAEVVRALSTSAVYLDLGNHPGKDRMPREAALAGALTIVSRRGSGAFFGDTPLPATHKVNTDGDLAADAARIVTTALENLAVEVAKQDDYRQWILSERDKFALEVSRVFVDHVTQDDSLGLATAPYAGGS